MYKPFFRGPVSYLNFHLDFLSPQVQKFGRSFCRRRDVTLFLSVVPFDVLLVKHVSLFPSSLSPLSILHIPPRISCVTQPATSPLHTIPKINEDIETYLGLLLPSDFFPGICVSNNVCYNIMIMVWDGMQQ